MDADWKGGKNFVRARIVLFVHWLDKWLYVINQPSGCPNVERENQQGSDDIKSTYPTGSFKNTKMVLCIIIIIASLRRTEQPRPTRLCPQIPVTEVGPDPDQPVEACQESQACRLQFP